tara:strand:- start:3998 stop:5866 length:1869 start_codon:yes stop_codon:yes gene_type:complete
MKRFFSALGRIIDTLRTFLGRIFFLLVAGLILFLLFSSPPTVSVPSSTALVWSPSGVVMERSSGATPADLLFGTGLPVNSLLQDLLDSLALAADDSRVTALVIDVSELLSVSPAHLETLGNALQQFADTGKPIYSYGEYYTQAQYALASYADHITLHPMGNLLISGFGGNQLFFRDLLEKLRVNVHIFRVGEFKSAAEPFTRMDMSPEARSDSQTLVDNLWARYLDRVSANRDLQPQQLQAYADNYAQLLEAAGGDMSRVAFEQGLVDNLAGVDSFRREVAAVAGTSNGSFNQIGYRDYLSATRAIQIPGASQVGIIVAQGTIMPGEQPLGMIGADTLSELIRRAQRDPAIKAVVLRVDSPGGSAMASEEIRAALVQLQASGKPLVVSMAGTAASGGYWISANADEIWASPSTVTGSIGVIGIIPTFEDALGELGVGVDGVGTTALSRVGDPFSGLDEQIGRIYQTSTEDTYQRFLRLVADGRDMTVDEVDQIAGGRVWSGEQALSLGLVDSLGDLDDALSAAASLAGLEEYQRVYLERPLSAGEQFLVQMMENWGGAQALASITGRSQSWTGLGGVGRILPALPAEQRQRLQSLVDLVLSSGMTPAQLRTLAVCESCLSVQ